MWLLLLVVSLLAVVLRRRRPCKGLPPGPRGLPLFGNILEISRAERQGPGLFNKWRRQFGDIYSVRLGSHDAVVLSDVKMIKEAFLKMGDHTSGRASNVLFIRMLSQGGIVANEGTSWKETRRAALRSMRDFGMGKRPLEQRIQEEAQELLDTVEAKQGQPFDPKVLLQSAFCNVTCHIIFGKRFAYDDAVFQSLLYRVNFFIENCGTCTPEIFVPALTPLMPITNRRFFKSVTMLIGMRRIIQDYIKANEADFDPQHVRSFVDLYLKTKREDSAENKQIFTEDNLLATIFDLFLAGLETSSTTVRWLCLYLVCHPGVQERCRREIAEVIPDTRLPLPSDRRSLPYLEAVIWEVMRITSVVPYGVMHRATSDVAVGGYTLPRDTLLISNLQGLHMDRDYWGDPHTFRPERWLGEDGASIKHEPFLPFSIGPRECPGKSLALHEIFVVVASLLQRFSLEPEDPDSPPSIQGSLGGTYYPAGYTMVARKL